MYIRILCTAIKFRCYSYNLLYSLVAFGVTIAWYMYVYHEDRYLTTLNILSSAGWNQIQQVNKFVQTTEAQKSQPPQEAFVEMVLLLSFDFKLQQMLLWYTQANDTLNKLTVNKQFLPVKSSWSEWMQLAEDSNLMSHHLSLHQMKVKNGLGSSNKT